MFRLEFSLDDQQAIEKETAETESPEK